MTQRILVEILLFLIPFAVFLVYRLAAKEARVRDRWPLTTLASVGAGFAILALLLAPVFEGSDKGKCYQAARYENGVTIPAKKVDCKAATPPERPATPTPSSTPVAPRDQNK